MYEITEYSKLQAKKLGVEIKPSSNKKKKLDVFADRVVKWVKSRTPEDTQDLVKSIWKSTQTFTWTKILQKIYDKNNLHYTPYVEYWVWWNKYNYHKPKWSVFLVAVWAWMFRRTYFDLKDKF